MHSLDVVDVVGSVVGCVVGNVVGSVVGNVVGNVDIYVVCNTIDTQTILSLYHVSDHKIFVTVYIIYNKV